MSQKTMRTPKDMTMGNTAVDGLLAGILAGLSMAVYLVLVGLLTGIMPAFMLGRFDPGLDSNWLTGSLAHLAVAGIYGVVFALLFAGLVRLRPSLLRWGWLLGLGYGLLLLALAWGVVLPAMASPILQITAVHLLIAHAIYGLVLGFQVSRKW